MSDDNIQISKPRPSKVFQLLNVFFTIAFLGMLSYYLLSAPQNNKAVTIHIAQNQTMSAIAKDLENRNVIRHDYILKALVSAFNFDRKIASGDYLFESNSSVIKVAWQIAQSRHNILPIKITFKEGMTNEEMADLLASKLSLFRRDLFLSDPLSKQGYLFPDTYFFFSMSTTDEILNALTSNFDKRLSALSGAIKSQDKSESDIIIMASLIEREASGKDDAPIISGILWKRLSIGMPLQVDVDKSTYNNKGLPVEPINNPGLASIKAAISPVSSSYLYYLHDKKGQVHLAINYEEHQKNIRNYLK